MQWENGGWAEKGSLRPSWLLFSFSFSYFKFLNFPLILKFYFGLGYISHYSILSQNAHKIKFQHHAYFCGFYVINYLFLHRVFTCDDA
jgi:hypothetical protein